MNDDTKAFFTLSGNEYLHGVPANPQIGDLRVSFETVKPSEISIVGKQSGSQVTLFHIKTGNIALLEYGNIEADMMFDDAEHENVVTTWAFRGVGLFIMFIGINMILGPIAVLASIIPFVGYLVEYGTGLIAALLALVLSAGTITIAWFTYRPVMSIIFLIASFLISGFMLKRKKNLNGHVNSAMSNTDMRLN